MSEEDFTETFFDVLAQYFFLIRRDGDQLPGKQGGSHPTTIPSSSVAAGNVWSPSYLTAFPDPVASAPLEEVPSIEWVLEKAKSAVQR